MRSVLLGVLVSLLAFGLVFAGGFSLYEFGARASAMGGAVVAQAADASSVFYNPAGVSHLEGTNFYGGVTLIFPKTVYVGPEPLPWAGQKYESEKQVFTPIGVYVTHRFSEKLGAGIGLTNPFGLGLKWGDDFPGKALSRNVNLQSFYISPVVAYQITPEFSIGGGLDFVISNVVLERSVYMFGTEGGSLGTYVGESKLEGTSKLAIGFSGALLYRTDRLGLGFLYRHSVKNKFEDGKVKFTLVDTEIPNIKQFASALLKDQGGSTEITYPSFISAGVYYKVTPQLGVEADIMYYNWSVFDKLVLDFDDDRLNQEVPEEYENSLEFRLGLHYDLNEQFSIRAGYIYDQTPQPVGSVSPLLADNDRNDLSLGVGYKTETFQVDAGWMFVDFGERSTIENGEGKNFHGFDGAYASQANLFFVSFGYSIK